VLDLSPFVSSALDSIAFVTSKSFTVSQKFSIHNKIFLNWQEIKVVRGESKQCFFPSAIFPHLGSFLISCFYADLSKRQII
jgi:hypothetical protein